MTKRPEPRMKRIVRNRSFENNSDPFRGTNLLLRVQQTFSWKVTSCSCFWASRPREGGVMICIRSMLRPRCVCPRLHIQLAVIMLLTFTTAPYLQGAAPVSDNFDSPSLNLIWITMELSTSSRRNRISRRFEGCRFLQRRSLELHGADHLHAAGHQTIEGGCSGHRSPGCT
jgi:hypothetical protein